MKWNYDKNLAFAISCSCDLKQKGWIAELSTCVK